MNLRKFVESTLFNEISMIKYLGIQDGNGLVFEINGVPYKYFPKDIDLNEWDAKVREVIGKYSKTGAALKYVKDTASGYLRLDAIIK